MKIQDRRKNGRILRSLIGRYWSSRCVAFHDCCAFTNNAWIRGQGLTNQFGVWTCGQGGSTLVAQFRFNKCFWLKICKLQAAKSIILCSNINMFCIIILDNSSLPEYFLELLFNRFEWFSLSEDLLVPNVFGSVYAQIQSGHLTSFGLNVDILTLSFSEYPTGLSSIRDQ